MILDFLRQAKHQRAYTFEESRTVSALSLDFWALSVSNAFFATA
jgi:hypothetical protein